MRSRSSSMAVDPHSPHEVLVAASRGAGAGAAPPVSTLTTLNSLSTALARAAVAAADHGAPASSPSPWSSPTASSKSLPGVRMVVATRWPSRCTSSGSSTMRRSGRRWSAWPSQCWVSFVAVRPRVTAPRVSRASVGGVRRSVASGRSAARGRGARPCVHAYTSTATTGMRSHTKLVCVAISSSTSTPTISTIASPRPTRLPSLLAQVAHAGSGASSTSSGRDARRGARRLLVERFSSSLAASARSSSGDAGAGIDQPSQLLLLVDSSGGSGGMTPSGSGLVCLLRTRRGLLLHATRLSSRLARQETRSARRPWRRQAHAGGVRSSARWRASTRSR